ncbi:MAG: CpsD/CapB family tyrosine-protein kinase, partial [Bacteroidota bacterium]
ADMRKPRVHDQLGLSNEDGLSSYLIGRASLDEVIRSSALPHLDVITSGPVPPNPSELLLRDRFKQLVDELKKDYHHILIDVPPIGLITDGNIVMKYTDVNIILFRQNHSKRSAVRIIRDLNNQGKLPRFGVVLNGVKRSNNKGYGYYEDDKGNGGGFRSLISR